VGTSHPLGRCPPSTVGNAPRHENPPRFKLAPDGWSRRRYRDGVRVVAGTARGRRLLAPAGPRTRPTSDRVREAAFDILGSMTDLAGAAVVDLFAGSGALGIEALSRGAATATFVEQDRAALDVLRANLAALGFGGPRATVLGTDAVRWAANQAYPRPGATGPPGVDVVFADPPYAFDGWPALVGSLGAWSALAVLETGHELELPSDWQVVRQRRYGATVVTVARPAPRPEGFADAKGGL
jgi:16S rRNA (guanine966-N2)-methyltransferase